MSALLLECAGVLGLAALAGVATVRRRIEADAVPYEPRHRMPR